MIVFPTVLTNGSTVVFFISPFPFLSSLRRDNWRLLHEGDLLRCFRNSGLGHVRMYAPFVLILSALHLILRAKSQHI